MLSIVVEKKEQYWLLCEETIHNAAVGEMVNYVRKPVTFYRKKFQKMTLKYRAAVLRNETYEYQNHMRFMHKWLFKREKVIYDGKKLSEDYDATTDEIKTYKLTEYNNYVTGLNKQPRDVNEAHFRSVEGMNFGEPDDELMDSEPEDELMDGEPEDELMDGEPEDELMDGDAGEENSGTVDEVVQVSSRLQNVEYLRDYCGSAPVYRDVNLEWQEAMKAVEATLNIEEPYGSCLQEEQFAVQSSAPHVPTNHPPMQEEPLEHYVLTMSPVRARIINRILSLNGSDITYVQYVH